MDDYEGPCRICGSDGVKKIRRSLPAERPLAGGPAPVVWDRKCPNAKCGSNTGEKGLGEMV
ncbi:MAG: hypothetical protein JW722_03395 [Demequinaceae bacterium]|nr:hypothetical protein [Demequinaceae bacterium]